MPQRVDNVHVLTPLISGKRRRVHEMIFAMVEQGCNRHSSTQPRVDGRGCQSPKIRVTHTPPFDPGMRIEHTVTLMPGAELFAFEPQIVNATNWRLRELPWRRNNVVEGHRQHVDGGHCRRPIASRSWKRCRSFWRRRRAAIRRGWSGR